MQEAGVNQLRRDFASSESQVQSLSRDVKTSRLASATSAAVNWLFSADFLAANM